MSRLGAAKCSPNIDNTGSPNIESPNKTFVRAEWRDWGRELKIKAGSHNLDLLSVEQCENENKDAFCFLLGSFQKPDERLGLSFII